MKRDFASEIDALLPEVEDLCEDIRGCEPGSEDQGCAAMDLVARAQAIEHLVDEAYDAHVKRSSA